jgi:hypothetical protein
MPSKLDRTLWESHRWPLSEHFFDGSFAVMKLIMQMTNEELQENYLKEDYEERKKGREKYDPLGGVLVFFRGEFDRRLKNGLVAFDDPGNDITQARVEELQSALAEAEERLRSLKPSNIRFFSTKVGNEAEQEKKEREDLRKAVEKQESVVETLRELLKEAVKDELKRASRPRASELLVVNGISMTRSAAEARVANLELEGKHQEAESLRRMITGPLERNSEEESKLRSGTISDYSSCFISFSSKDEEFAKRLHADLRAASVRCWFAPEDMKIGQRIRPGLDEAIRKHDKLLLVLSEHSVASDWVETEVETAFARERVEKKAVVFPVRLDDTVFDTPVAWARQLKGTRHIGDFRNWKNHDSYQSAFQGLLRDLKSESRPKPDSKASG